MPTGNSVNWSWQYGALCPQCAVFTKESYKQTSWKSGCKTRYHLCPQCGLHFKSTAVDTAAPGLAPSWEQVKYLRSYRSKDGLEYKGGLASRAEVWRALQEERPNPADARYTAARG